MRLTIQNMVCPRCVESVQQIFQEENIPVEEVSLGSVETEGILDEDSLKRLSARLKERGFALVQDREKVLIEQMKVRLLEYLHHLESNDEPKKLSVFIGNKLHYNYSYLSKIFSEQMNETVENYLIRLKIERVKELLSYRTHTLSEIAWRLKYSSVQYLSNQFKKVTGETVTRYLDKKVPDRKSLDHL
ncbi:MAG: helix-turn-helix transcriptional regulator [Balneolaceae bacterium]